MSNDAGGTQKNQKGPFFRRGCNPASRANLQQRGKPSNNPAGRRGQHSLQSELEAIMDPDGFFKRYMADLEKTTRMLKRLFRQHTGHSLDAATQRAYGWKLASPQRRTAA
jgi:hypothetical protein